MKPTPITNVEKYLDVATGGSTELPTPIPRLEKYYAKIAGMDVDLPTPVTVKEKYLAKIAGMDVDVPTYSQNMPTIYAFLAAAAGQDVDVPTPVLREEMYWYEYIGGGATEKEYTGVVPYTFTANGEPLIDWSIYGNTVQSGTSTPQNPVMPEGCGNMTENLFDKDSLTKFGTTSNFSVNGTTITMVGSSGAGNYYYNNTLLPSGNYSLTFNGAESSAYYIVMASNSDLGNAKINGRSLSQNQASIAARLQMDYARYISPDSTSLSVYSDVPFIICFAPRANEWVISNVMLNTGSTALPYEPYGIKIPFSSANTTTPVYLGEVQTTRKVKKLVLTGTENVYVEINMYNIRGIPKAIENWSELICTHFIRAASYNECNDAVSGRGKCGVSSREANNSYLWFNKSEFETSGDFKAFLQQQYAAGTPVTVWYVLATPQTAVVNEPLMKIGTYADSLTAEQAGVDIPTVNGSNTIDVDTTVKPSEVYIKWKGV